MPAILATSIIRAFIAPPPHTVAPGLRKVHECAFMNKPMNDTFAVVVMGVSGCGIGLEGR